MVITKSFSSRLSPLDFSLSWSLVILMKYEAIFRDFDIFIFDCLFLNVRVTFMLLCSNSFFKVLNIFLAVVFSEIRGTKWFLTESTKILLALASFFLQQSLSSLASSSGTFSFTHYNRSFSSSRRITLDFHGMKLEAPSRRSSTFMLIILTIDLDSKP